MMCRQCDESGRVQIRASGRGLDTGFIFAEQQQVRRQHCAGVFSVSDMASGKW